MRGFIKVEGDEYDYLCFKVGETGPMKDHQERHYMALVIDKQSCHSAVGIGRNVTVMVLALNGSLDKSIPALSTTLRCGDSRIAFYTQSFIFSSFFQSQESVPLNISGNFQNRL